MKLTHFVAAIVTIVAVGSHTSYASEGWDLAQSLDTSQTSQPKVSAPAARQHQARAPAQAPVTGQTWQDVWNGGNG